jgi:hypothetical protein
MRTIYAEHGEAFARASPALCLRIEARVLADQQRAQSLGSDAYALGYVVD